jgi:hypothetical protein
MSPRTLGGPASGVNVAVKPATADFVLSLLVTPAAAAHGHCHAALEVDSVHVS